MTLFQVERQRTAGAYRPVKSFTSHKDAVHYLESIAKENPNYPYDGSDKYHIGNSTHNCTRYRISQVNVVEEGIVL